MGLSGISIGAVGVAGTSPQGRGDSLKQVARAGQALAIQRTICAHHREDRIAVGFGGLTFGRIDGSHFEFHWA